MNKILIFTAFLAILVPSTSFASYKTDYCNSQEYLGNEGKKTPHLHCGKDFLTYKKTADNHSNLNQFGNCKRTVEVIAEIKANKTAFKDYDAINGALAKYKKADCP